MGKKRCGVEGCYNTPAVTFIIQREDGRAELPACYQHFAIARTGARQMGDGGAWDAIYNAGFGQGDSVLSCLHVGCGQAREEHTPPRFNGPRWVHTRVDIDESVNPDIVDDIRTLVKVEDASYDAVFSSHNIEHLHSYEVINCLRSFYRVLKPGGALIVHVPDFGLACRLIGAGKGWEKLYDSPVGPIFPIDLVYGHRGLSAENPYMEHRTGFTKAVLTELLFDTWFSDIQVMERNCELQAFARKG